MPKAVNIPKINPLITVKRAVIAYFASILITTIVTVEERKDTANMINRNFKNFSCCAFIRLLYARTS